MDDKQFHTMISNLMNLELHMPEMSPFPPKTNPIEPKANPYRAHLVGVANELHRKLTGCPSGTSRYKGLYGRWCQAQEDLVAWENLCGGESAGGGPLIISSEDLPDAPPGWRGAINMDHLK